MEDKTKEIKIGMYSTDEILEFMTNGEGRGFMGRSMYDAILDYITNLQTIEQQYSSILSENAELENKITNLQEYNQIYNIDNKEVEEIINKNDILKKYFINLKHEIIDANKYRDEIEILRKENFKLKEENERYKKIFEGKERFSKIMPDDIDFIIMSKADYDRQVDDIELVAQELKSRNEKAIEYINHEIFKRTILVGVGTKKYTRNILDNVLNILQGEDKDE